MRKKNFHISLILVVILIVVALGVLWLRSRASFSKETEKFLTSQMDSGKKIVSLPRNIEEGTWDEALIVCPYFSYDQAPQKYRSSLKKIDSLTDTSQWLIYKVGTSFATHEISRTEIDLCSGTTSFAIFHPDQQFSVNTAQASEKPRILVVVSP